MYAGVVTMQVRPGKMDGFIHIYQASVVPAFMGQKGFCETQLFTDPTSGKGLLLTLWETEGNLRAFEASGQFQAQLARFQPVLSAPATREHYEVSV